MSNLLLSALAMMGLTFLIGFFVAGVIKIIANWADFLDFYNLHREELLNLKRKSQHHTAMVEAPAVNENKHSRKHPKLAHRMNFPIHGLSSKKRITA